MPNSPTDNELRDRAVRLSIEIQHHWREWQDSSAYPDPFQAYLFAALKGVRALSRTEAPPVCRRCNGSRTVRVKHGRTFDTDSAAERADAWGTERCPDCAVPTPPAPAASGTR